MAYFKNDRIGVENGILQHYQRNIQKLIGEPYRRDVRCELWIAYVRPDDSNRISVTEKMSYTCRSNTNGIQDTVSWVSDGWFTHEVYHSVTFSIETTVNGKAHISEEKFLFERFEDAWKIPHGIQVPIPERFKKDGLEVRMHVSYEMSTQLFNSWRMAYMTDGFYMSVNFPPELFLATEQYSIGRNSFIIDDEKAGFCSIRAKIWLLPDDGIAFQLRPYEKKNEEIAKTDITHPEIIEAN